jgi:hypothetical protein
MLDTSYRCVRHTRADVCSWTDSERSTHCCWIGAGVEGLGIGDADLEEAQKSQAEDAGKTRRG